MCYDRRISKSLARPRRERICLTFADGSVGHLILFDVWHYLEFPGTALREFYRVLSPDGKLIIFDPAMALFGRIVLGLFYYEPLGLREAIQWEAPPSFVPGEHSYYAAQGNASRVFGTADVRPKLSDWRISELRFFAAFSCLAFTGLSGPQLYPSTGSGGLGFVAILSWLSGRWWFCDSVNMSQGCRELRFDNTLS